MRNVNGVRGIIASSSFHVPVEGQALSLFVLGNGGMRLKKRASDFKDMFNRVWVESCHVRRASLHAVERWGSGCFALVLHSQASSVEVGIVRHRAQGGWVRLRGGKSTENYTQVKV